MLRGVNLGGSSKVPIRPDGSTYHLEGFFDHRGVSFTGRPFPLEEAPEHYKRLREWGFNCLRFLVTWEAIEHAGPGIYDEEYLDYLVEVVKKAGEYGFYVFIDPHQDVWSRFSGGDGAPGWTLECAGLDMHGFKSTGAAIVHQTHSDPLPKMHWPTNAYKLAAATMFTLFFAGNEFAPATKVDGVPIQDYLQAHFFSSIKKVVSRLKDLDCVIGYDSFNEPQRGYVGIRDLRQRYGELELGIFPTPWQSILLGSGFTQKVEVLKRGIFSAVVQRYVNLNKGNSSAWLPGKSCVWRENGVWDIAPDGSPLLLRPDHFYCVNDHPVDFVQDYLLPFIKTFAENIHEIDPQAWIFAESEPEKSAPMWHDARDSKVVYAPHWYDGVTLLFKKHIPWLGADLFTRKPIFGGERIRRSYKKQLEMIKAQGKENLGNVPVLLGEFGIPFDLEQKKAYITGDESKQLLAMDRSMQAVEANLLNFTLWNYTADNTNERGDRWNDEDLSIFSRDQQHNAADINSGGRALAAVVRPYPVLTSGTPQALDFDFTSGRMEYQYIFDPTIESPTILFIPRLQYPDGIIVSVSSGEYKFHPESQTLEHQPLSAGVNSVIIKRK